MANGYFVVQNGLQVGPLTIDASTGTITTVGDVNITGNLGVSQISKDNSSVTIDDTGAGSKIVLAIDGVITSTIDANGLTSSPDDSVTAFLGTAGLTNQVLVASKDVDSFIQVALHNPNSGASASADFIAYADTGDNTQGYVDMGIASSVFNDPAYGITFAGDSYIFASAPAGTGGNLVLATDNGTVGDIVFAAGGFTSGTEQGRFILGDGLKLSGNLIADGGTVYQGPLAKEFEASASITDPAAIFTGNINSFIQVGLHNKNTGVSASADYIAYADTGNNINGYIDMGIASTTFNDPLFAVTKAGDGYIFLSAPAYANTTPTGGNLVLATSDGSFNDIVFAAGGFFDGTEQGRFVLNDGLYLTGNLIASQGTIYQGAGAKNLEVNNEFYPGYVGLTNSSAIYVGDQNDFVQFALKNLNYGASASTDIIAYASDGDNDSGWIDMGITSNTYSDPGFTVTGPAVGYIFMSAPAGTAGTGDLLVGTDATGTQNDIAFFSDGFAAGNERMRIVGTDRPGKPAGVEIYITTESVSTSTGALRVQGGIGLLGNLNVAGDVDIIGNLSFGGAGTTVSSSTLTVENPIIFLGNSNPANSFDIGLVGSYVDGSPGRNYTGIARQATSGIWRLFDNLDNLPATSALWNNTVAAGMYVGNLMIANTTVSSSTTSGALIVGGGVGIGGKAYIGGDITVTGSILPSANLTYNVGSSANWFNTFYGVSTQAKYADLAENYQADSNYAPGTVLEFGGAHEVTIATDSTKRVAGVVSSNPAHLMNGGLQGANVVPLALQGRVPCKVIGPIAKGDLMVSAGFGYAKANNDAQLGQVIGKALADFTGAKGQIEVVVGRV